MSLLEPIGVLQIKMISEFNELRRAKKMDYEMLDRNNPAVYVEPETVQIKCCNCYNVTEEHESICIDNELCSDCINRAKRCPVCESDICIDNICHHCGQTYFFLENELYAVYEEITNDTTEIIINYANENTHLNHFYTDRLVFYTNDAEMYLNHLKLINLALKNLREEKEKTKSNLNKIIQKFIKKKKCKI